MQANKRLVIGILSIVGVFAILALVGPLFSERDATIDRQIEQDLSEISFLAEDYYYNEGRLPDSLNDLDLEGDLLARSREHNYSIDRDSSTTYQLCADFKTDTTSDSGEDAYTSYYYGPTDGHKAGPDCLDYEVYDYYNEPFGIEEAYPELDYETFEL